MSDVCFYSRSSIRFARCDCIEGTLCEHVVLAVQAFGTVVGSGIAVAQLDHLRRGQRRATQEMSNMVYALVSIDPTPAKISTFAVGREVNRKSLAATRRLFSFSRRTGAVAIHRHVLLAAKLPC